MKSRAKRLPRLWCALQGLLPLEACLAAQRGELAWPTEANELHPVRVRLTGSEAKTKKPPLGRPML